MDIISYILSRQFTKQSLIGMGALKGSPCKIKDIIHQDGINTVVFEWEGTDGSKRESQMVVYDGTPIYVWESGNTYHYGDLAIYESQFYRCIVENSDVTFDDTKWNEIGSPDGNYDIVQSKALLPARFTAADRKLYFVIDECIFYLWDGYQWVALNHAVQVDSFPEASAKYFGKIYQYIGTTNASYIHGYFYQCVSDGETPATYSWEYVQTSDIQIATVQKAGIVKPDDETIQVDANGTISVIDRLFVGTQAQWDALTSVQKALYKPVHITDDEEVLDLGVYLRKVKTMPNAEDAPSEFVMYIGATTADYTRGYIYRSVPSVVNGETVYNWVRQDVQPSHPYVQSDWSQNNSSANDYIKNKPTLGTASEKNFTDNVRPNSHDLVESNAVYNAISSSIASIYKPHGDLTCAQLTSDLLIPTNIGNVYNMTDSGTTSALFIQGVGKTIHVNDTVGIIQADNSEIMFNLMGSMLDLHDYQTKELETPLTINGVQETEVEDALGAIVDTLDNVKKYNVLNYGLVGDGVTDNTTALSNLLTTLPWGAIVYFPRGVYNISSGFTINKSVFFEGETTTQQRYVTSSSQPNLRLQDSAINYVGNTANTILFNITGSVNCVFKNMTFYGHAYSVSDNTDTFTTIPYPFFKEQEITENVNCLTRDGGIWSVENCMFLGFSGYAVKIHHNTYVKNCGFYECNVGILEEGTDSNIQSCFFTRCGTAIKTTNSTFAGQSITYTNLNVCDCWCDQGVHHFIQGDNTGNVMYNIDNAWIDMIDESAIYVPDATIKKSSIQGRFSRCGMKYAIPQSSTLDPSYYNQAVIICAKRIVDSDMHISCEKRNIGVGNNPNGYCPYKLCVVTSSGQILNNHIYTDMTYNDITTSATYSSEVHTLDYSDIERYSIWDYHFGKFAFRNNSPIGVVKALDANRFVYDTVHKTLYRSTAANDNTAWEIVTEPTQLSTMPTASATYLGKLVQYIGTTTSNYTHGYFYECVSDEQDPTIYSWQNVNVQPTAGTPTAATTTFDNTTSELQATNVQDAIDEVDSDVDSVESDVSTLQTDVGNIQDVIPSTATSSNKLIDHDSLGTAAFKDSTDRVSPNNTALVESQSVYSAINTALSSIYKPRGDITCAELTSDLLIEANIGNIYETSDSGTTSALFLQGAGVSIPVGSNVGIISAGQGRILFNLMANAFDLTSYQKINLAQTVEGATTVEGALSALSTNKATQTEVQTLTNNVKTRAELGAYNLLNIFNSEINTSGTYTEVINDDGTVKIGGTPTSACTIPYRATTNYNGNVYNLKPNTDYVLDSGLSAISPLQLQVFVKENSSSSWTKIAETAVNTKLTFTTPTTFYDLWVRILIPDNVVVSADTIVKPMIILASDITIGFVPYAKTNVELTQDKAEQSEVNDIVNILGAKNILNNEVTTNSDWHGVNRTVNADGTITLSGTSTAWDFANFNYVQGQKSIPSGTYIINGSCENTALAIVADGSVIARQYGARETTFTITDNMVETYARFEMFTDKTFTSESSIIYPMIRLASDPDNTYVPYSMTNQQITPYVQAISNPNLLDNPWFTVNQRGLSTLSASGYFCDRWMMTIDSGTLNAVASGIEVDATSNAITFAQKTMVDTNMWDGTTPYTWSIDFTVEAKPSTSDRIQMFFNSNCTVGQHIYQTLDMTPSDYTVGRRYLISGTRTLTTDYDVTKPCALVWLYLRKGWKIIIHSIKVEKGTVSTLAMDTAPNYATELLKCQRYFERIGGMTYQMFGSGIYESGEQFTIYTKIQPKRVEPTATLSGTVYCWDGTHIGSSGLQATSMPVVQVGKDGNGRLSFTVSGGTTGQVGMAQFRDTTSHIDFSADL